MSAPGNQRRAASGRDDWETPDYLFQKLNREFHFTLDAAADESNKKVAANYRMGPCIGKGKDYSDVTLDSTVAELRPWHPSPPACLCGLCSSWREASTFLNPPYSQPPNGSGLGVWVEKMIQERGRGALVVALLPNATDTRWFARIYETADEIRLMTPRVQFVGSSKGGNTGGNLIAVWRRLQGERLQPRPLVILWRWQER